MASSNGTNGKERAETRRVVLERARVIVLPAGVTDVDAKKLAEALGVPAKTKIVTSTEAWLVAGEFGGASKEKAIEAYAGKAGTPDAKVGAFRAVPVSAWKDGVRHEAPPRPLVEKKALA